MTTPVAATTTRAVLHAINNTARTLIRPPRFSRVHRSTLRYSLLPHTVIQSPRPRHFSVSPVTHSRLMPESENPTAPQAQPTEAHVAQATEIDDEEYHERSDEYMETVYERAEELQESRDDVEVEYSAGVLSITFPPNGTYVINKQPPNKQIWISSPVSGPKRYDFVLAGEGIHQKEGGGSGEWVYLRDGSTLTDLLSKELGIVVE